MCVGLCRDPDIAELWLRRYQRSPLLAKRLERLGVPVPFSAPSVTALAAETAPPVVAATLSGRVSGRMTPQSADSAAAAKQGTPPAAEGAFLVAIPSNLFDLILCLLRLYCCRGYGRV